MARCGAARGAETTPCPTPLPPGSLHPVPAPRGTSAPARRSCDSLKGGLNKLAEDLDVERVGPMHTAGSDSLLTSSTFFKLRTVFFDGRLDENKFRGVLFGLGVTGSGGGVPGAG